mmetsp:Transcript_29541/g.57824  ORF Transcript_29541/g.57824 Transcript_29541/m.57824 type:complete len:222 (-) Transcript_29541:697-1362(-)
MPGYVLRPRSRFHKRDILYPASSHAPPLEHYSGVRSRRNRKPFVQPILLYIFRQLTAAPSGQTQLERRLWHPISPPRTKACPWTFASAWNFDKLQASGRCSLDGAPLLGTRPAWSWLGGRSLRACLCCQKTQREGRRHVGRACGRWEGCSSKVFAGACGSERADACCSSVGYSATRCARSLSRRQVRCRRAACLSVLPMGLPSARQGSCTGPKGEGIQGLA